MIRRTRDFLRRFRRDEDGSSLLYKIENSVVTGFQLATAAGPLCEEPVWGVAFVVERIELAEDADSDENYGPLTGQVISIMKTACRQAFLARQVRLVEAIYDCSVQCSAEQLGKCYSVI